MGYTDSAAESAAVKTRLDTTAARSAVADAYSPSTKLSIDTPAKPEVVTPSGQLVFTNLFGNDATPNSTTASTDSNGATNRGTEGNGTTIHSSDDNTVPKTDTTSTTADATLPPTAATITTDAHGTPAKPNPNAQAESAALLQQEAQTQPPADITASITPEGERQGNVGDCYFLAPLDSMANSPQGQQMIRNMIKTNSDGTYTVTFPGDPTHPVNVTAQEIAKQTKLGAVNDTSPWAQVAETAFLKYDGVGSFGTNALTWQNAGEGSIPWLGSTSFTDQAMQLLTGQDVTTDSIGPVNALGSNLEVTVGNTSKANIANAIQTALQNGEPITATAVENTFATAMGAHSALGPVGPDGVSSSLDGDHMYPILSFDPKSETIVLRNPWNSNTNYAAGTTRDGITGLPNGELQMSLDTFMQRYNAVNIAGLTPYANDQANTNADMARTSATVNTARNDLLSGNFGALSADTTNFANYATQTASDMAYETTDLSERSVEAYLAPDTAKMMNVVNALWTPTQGLMEAADGMTIAAQNYGSALLNDLNPNWFSNS